ncbi:hypothetical protein BDK51DRAFT_29818 [Blyttiomyces helicus]|uniref:Uncharacterized protein n=1 Tax=Blyttiomyces helicus TaxID=388810 RepID=A0A4P9WAV2_9FUNG|nr:hypothetical protein BDK51DRAFT_29818 [Blyttiomyces helicus]|eukprot:RKO88705.1 hypothetical protein BDK51DRAFT_29818 [Blyttiomyces helicus]
MLSVATEGDSVNVFGDRPPNSLVELRIFLKKMNHFADDDEMSEWDIGNGFANGLTTTEEIANFGEDGRHVGFGWSEGIRLCDVFDEDGVTNALLLKIIWTSPFCGKAMVARR